MKTLLRDIYQDIREFIALQKEQMDDTECLRDLFVVDPRFDVENIKKSKEKLLEDA